MKTCASCNETKELTEFYIRQAKCKKCCIKKRREWALKHPNDVRRYFKKFKKNNIERYKKQQQEYCERNRELLSYKSGVWKKQNRDKWNDYIKKFKKKNPSYRIAEQLRSRIYHALKGKSKSQSTQKMLGCSFIELKKYLESKFKSQMTWKNYGKWHIDHIKPCSSFDLTKEDEQRKCFHYTNLQPLWAIENLKKHSHFIL